MGNDNLDLLLKDRQLVTSKEMARLFGYKTEDSLRKQRYKNRSLFPYTKIRGRIFYDLQKTLELAERNLVKPV
tara:strand:- start:439 stop:657 length:219 start_codon:yes stop_codon:yes gene_type:complete